MSRRPFALLAFVVTSALMLPGCSSDSSPAPTEADLSIAPSGGTVITDFVCDASGSSRSRRALECRWDWESDGTWDTGWTSELTVEHRFSQGDTITVTVEVTDGEETDTAAGVVTLDTRHGTAVAEVPVFGPAPRVICSDGTYLWTASWEERRIRKLDPATGDTVSTIPGVSAWPNGMAWDGTHMWITDYLSGMRMFKVDAATGDTLLTFPIQYSGFPGGLAWDGEYLYEGISSGGPESIRKYTTAGAFVEAIQSPRGSIPVTGLSYDGVNLWVSCAGVDTMYAVDPEDGAVRFCVPADGLTHDIAVDGQGYLWAIRGGVLTRIVP